MRAALVLAVLAAGAAAQAAEDPPPAAGAAAAGSAAPAPSPVPRGDHAPLVARLGQGDKTAIAEAAAFLAHPHVTPAAERRLLLEGFGAQVPDDKGRFVAPQRKPASEEKKLDELDWLAELTKLDAATPGRDEAIADVTLIRALAASKDIDAARALFDVAFGAETMIYRDEVGRYIRTMEPYCIPALMKEASSKSFDRRRYSNYQLERLDRQEPRKALAAATGDEQLTIAILETWRQTKHREAVHAVWGKVNADSPRVRAKARETWRAYVEGPAPPPAPKKKLMLPGGKLTKEEKPLWLTYRELADNELRKQSNELLGTDYLIVDPTLDDSDEFKKKPKPQRINLVNVTKELFEFYDAQRAEQEAKQWAEAEAKSKAGDIAGSALLLDRLLAANPDHGNRAQMALVYLAHARELERAKNWPDAAAAYSKAHGLAPQGPNATDALAAHHYTLGKALEAQGKDGGPDFRKAIALRPDYAPAKEAAVRASGGSRPVWMLYGAGLAMLVALGLAAAAMVRRRGKTAA